MCKKEIKLFLTKFLLQFWNVEDDFLFYRPFFDKLINVNGFPKFIKQN